MDRRKRADLRIAVVDLIGSAVAVTAAVAVFGPKSKYTWISALAVSVLSTLSKSIKVWSLEQPELAPKNDPDRKELQAALLDYSVTPVALVLQSTTNPERWLLRLGCGHDVWIHAKRKPRGKTALCRECPIVGLVGV